MATYKGPEYKGTIDGMIHYESNGIKCVRTKPKHVYNPKTKKQRSVRLKLGNCSKFGSGILHSIIHPYWNLFAKKEKGSGYNLFMSYNSYAFRDGVFSVNYLRLILGNGLQQEKFEVARIENRLHISWDSSIANYNKDDQDELCLLIIKPDLNVELLETKVIRADQKFDIESKAELKQHYFIFWKNGGKWSESKLVFSE